MDAGTGAVPGTPDPVVPDHEDAGQPDTGEPLPDAGAAPPFVLTSPAFAAGERLPNAHSCVGGAVSPPLAWSAGPTGTQSYAVALITRNQTFQTVQQTTQWLVWDIHAEELPAGVAAGEQPSNVAGAHQANSTVSTLPILTTPPSYVAPCVLTGIDEFEFVVYALSVPAFPITAPASPDAIVSQLESAPGVLLGRSTLPFTFP